MLVYQRVNIRIWLTHIETHQFDWLHPDVAQQNRTVVSYLDWTHPPAKATTTAVRTPDTRLPHRNLKRGQRKVWRKNSTWTSRKGDMISNDGLWLSPNILSRLHFRAFRVPLSSLQLQPSCRKRSPAKSDAIIIRLGDGYRDIQKGWPESQENKVNL